MADNTHQVLSELLQSVEDLKNDIENGLGKKKHKTIRESVIERIGEVETDLEDYQYGYAVGDEWEPRQ